MRAFWLVMVMVSGSALAVAADPPAQAVRGQAIFFEESAGVQCGNCHALKGKGTAVGPDLSRLARLSPGAIVMAIRASRTEYVQTVKLKAGGEFPGMPAAKDDTSVSFYDLSVKPPALRKFDTKEVSSAKENSTWKHPPSTAKLTPEQLADVIGYIKFASYGDTKGVSPSDTQ